MGLDFSHLNQYELIFLVIAGVLLLVSGYRIKKVAFFIVWFIIGFTLMTHLLPFVNQSVPGVAVSELWQNLLPLAGGLLLALLGFTIEKLCLAGLTFGIVMVITVQYFGVEPMILGIGAIIGIILGALAVKLMKPATIILTSLAGAYVATIGLLTWIPAINGDIYYFPILIVLTALGSVIQFLTTKHSH